MPGQLSPRAWAEWVVVLVVAAGAVLALEVTQPQCVHICSTPTLGGETMTINNRTYWAESISVDDYTWIPVNGTLYTTRGNTTNATFFGFDFSLSYWQVGFGASFLNTTIVEPFGTAYHGGPFWTGESGVYSNTWFTPDNQSGVYAVPYDGPGTPPAWPIATVVLLVRTVI